VAIEIEQIKGKEHSLVSRAGCTPAAPILLQQAKVRHALVIEHDSFTIKNEPRGTESSCCFVDRREIACPIVATSSNDTNFVRLGVYRKTIAVPFDLVGGATPLGTFVARVVS
jgi:hypothetical protein